jgi:hypothetical protein
MTHKLTRVQNDTGEPINFTVVLDNVVFPLTNAGVVVDFIMKSPTAVASNAGHTACTITNAAAGQCTYTFQTGDLAEVGLYTCDLQVTDPTLAPFPQIVTEYAQYEINVRAQNG